MATSSAFTLGLLLESGGQRRRSGEALPTQGSASAAALSGHQGAAAAIGREQSPRPGARNAGLESAHGAVPIDQAPIAVPARRAAAGASGSPGPGLLSSRDALSQFIAAGPFASGSGGTSRPAGSSNNLCGCPHCRQTFRNNSGPDPQTATTVSLASGSTLGSSVDLSYTFKLHSLPGATKTIYLDFQGETTQNTQWNVSYNKSQIITPKFDFDGNINVFSNAELERIQYIFQRVAEDFAPFNINVTTEDPGSAALSKSGSGDTSWGAKAVIGGSCYDWFGNSAGGVSYINVFGNAYYSPSFVFTDQLGTGDEKYTAEAISHELGHQFGLSHDGSSTTAYYQGQGSGVTGWAPIMGVGYYQPISQWSKGEYSDANNKEDDLAIISSTSNGAGYRSDDFGNTSTSATLLSGTNFNQFGLIETSGDSDWFSFITGSGTVSLTISNACQAWVNTGSGVYSSYLLAGRSPNLDISASLFNAKGNLVATSNPSDSLSASFNIALSAGTYYLKVDGAGFGDPLTNGYSDYGSLGQYLVSGSVISPANLVISAPSTLLTSEAGGSASFSVRLSQAPTADVVVSLASSDGSEGSLGTSQLIFTTSNWDKDQSVSLVGRDDLLVDGAVAYSVSLSTSSLDPAFQNLQTPSLAASNADNDVAVPVWVSASLGTLVNNLSYSTNASVLGKVTTTTASDDVRLAITEGLIRSSSSSSSRSSALDGYQWQFDNLVNASQLQFEGYRTANGENDNFQFLVSTNSGSSWSPVLTVNNTTETILTANLATSISGSALVKVIDTNRSSGASNLDTLFVDRLALLSQKIDLRPDLSISTTSSQAVEDSAAEAVFTIRRGGDTSQSLDVAFSVSGSAGASDYSLLDAGGSVLNGSVRIGAGQSSASVRVIPTADGLSEGSETVLLSLVAPDDMLKLGNRSDRAVIVDTVSTSSTSRTAFPYPTASSESTVSGTVSGSLATTSTADGVVETIQEVLSGSDANATSQLEQRWSFQNLSAVTSFIVKAIESPGGDDQFRFEYAANGSNTWKSIGTLAANFNGVASFNLGTSLSGSLQLRVVDTNRNAGAGLIDSLAIDAMTFLTAGAPLPF